MVGVLNSEYADYDLLQKQAEDTHSKVESELPQYLSSHSGEVRISEPF